jgi:EAL domain-containing protein (putative c-di-GMP-specific phosphodiesterase class I)
VVDDLALPFVIDETELRLTASVGVSGSVVPTAKADTLLREADMAMYAAKRDGKASYRRFEPSMGSQLLDRIELEGDLRSALERHEIEVYYQPTIDLTTGAIVGVEALARWNHPLRGCMPPLTFIPTAEDSGLIVPLGLWILHRACVDAFDFPLVDGQRLWVAVNVSPRQLRDADFVSSVASVLAETGFPADRLVLEITETTLMSDMALCIDVLHRLRSLGIKIAVDDFGTGYSSLGYLKQLPIDVIKIDRSFTEGLRSGTQAAAVAHAIVTLGTTMQLAVVAEGIEDAGQARKLRDMACPFGQGLFFAHPMPLAALRDHVTRTGNATDTSAGRATATNLS